jgi:hypothetical protein
MASAMDERYRSAVLTATLDVIVRRWEHPLDARCSAGIA